MVEPTTCTESTRGAISSCTLAASPSASVRVRNPGAVTTSARVRRFGHVQLESAVGAGGGLRHHAHAVDDGDLRAARSAAPDGSMILPFISAAERQAEKVRKAGQQAWNVS